MIDDVLRSADRKDSSSTEDVGESIRVWLAIAQQLRSLIPLRVRSQSRGYSRPNFQRCRVRLCDIVLSRVGHWTSGRLRAMSHMLSRTCVGDTCEMGYPIVHRLRSLYIRKRRQRECKGSTSDLRPALWRSPSFFIFRSRTRPHPTTPHAPRGSLLHRKPFGRTTADMHLTGLYVTIVVAFLHASGSAVSTAKNVDAMPSMRGPVPPSGPSPIHN